MHFLNRLRIKIFKKHVGTDQFGNQYFVSRCSDHLGKIRRFVVYDGEAEGSKVPPLWHSWLHYLTNDIPDTNSTTQYDWQQEHVKNLTGTKDAFDPYRSNSMKPKYYSSWTPD